MSLRLQFAFLFVLGGVAGCATPPETVADTSSIDQQILEAAQRIEAAQVDLFRAGAINRQALPTPASQFADGTRVTVDWNGDALQLLSKLARDRGLPFAYVGVRQPLPITLNVKDTPLDRVLAQIRAQIGYRAEIRVDDGQVLLSFGGARS